jgi:hypothetical protein
MTISSWRSVKASKARGNAGRVIRSRPSDRTARRHGSASRGHRSAPGLARVAISLRRRGAEFGIPSAASSRPSAGPQVRQHSAPCNWAPESIVGSPGQPPVRRTGPGPNPHQQERRALLLLRLAGGAAQAAARSDQPSAGARVGDRGHPCHPPQTTPPDLAGSIVGQFNTAVAPDRPDEHGTGMTAQSRRPRQAAVVHS